MKLRLLGYWKSSIDSTLPDAAKLVDETWDESEREFISDYLSRGQVARQFMGPARCSFCGKLNGSTELSDGEYIWPSGLSHYVTDHSVRLPEAFVRHVFQRLADLEDASVDRSWWENQAYNE